MSSSIERADSERAGSERTDVVVVGAGPTGLLLAGDLAEAGVGVTLLERRPASDAKLTRAFAVHARTLEELDARGLAEELIARGHPVREIRPFSVLRISMAALPSRFPFVLVAPQYEVEGLLERRALAAGVRLLRGPEAEVVALRQDADGVDVETTGGTVHRARYVVGADGVRSAVRRLIAMPFPGESVLRSVMLADVRFKEAPADLLTVDANEHGFAFVVPFGDGWYRVIAWDPAPERQLPDDAPVQLEELRGVMRRVLGTDFGLQDDPRWIGRFHSDERQVPHYRRGRVLLAGDAAHVHSPAGGMGMNTGLQDAANLGWKLASVVRGTASDGLLDSYHEERWPVGRTVLRTSGAIVRIALRVSGGGPARRAAFRAVARVVGRVAPTRRGALRVSGLDVAYPAGGAAAGRFAGRRIPDLRLRGLDGGARTRLYEELRGGRFVLVTPRQVTGLPDGGRLAVAAPAGELRSTLLVRPDGYAAWSAESPSDVEIRAAVGEWV